MFIFQYDNQVSLLSFPTLLYSLVVLIVQVKWQRTSNEKP